MPARLNRLPPISLRDYTLSAVGGRRQTPADGSNRRLYGYARAALREALRLVAPAPGATVLFPDYVCDVALEPAHRLGISVSFYPVSDTLLPQWPALAERILQTRACAVMSVNYFGFPQPMDQWREVTRRTGVAWINDNAHGYGSRYRGIPLDDFGDVSVTSMRKVLPLVNGAGIRVNNAGLAPPRAQDVGSGWRRRLPNAEEWRRIGRTAQSMLGRNRRPRPSAPPYADLPPSSEHERRDAPMVMWSRRALARLDGRLTESVRRRRMIYAVWDRHCRGAGLHPVFPELPDGTSPMVYPCYTEDFEARQRWLSWAAARNIDAYPWPSLPSPCRTATSDTVKRWRRLLCFPIHGDMTPNQITSRWSRGVPSSS